MKPHTRKKPRRALSIAIVGAGRVGLAIGRNLRDKGHNIAAVVSRSAVSAAKGGRFLACRNFGTDVTLLPRDVDIIFIATPHVAVRDAAAAIANLDMQWQHCSACHASGMLTAEVLDPLKHKGAKVFSFHPLQTFPRGFPITALVPTVPGIYYGVDGEPDALRVAARLAKTLGGKTIMVPSGMRELYHAACVVASNHLTGLTFVLERMFARIQTGKRDFYPVFEPIIRTTLKNIGTTSPGEALSGPVARGGVETVREHLKALTRHVPEVLPFFICMTEETALLAKMQGTIDESRHREFLRLAEDFKTTEVRS